MQRLHRLEYRPTAPPQTKYVERSRRARTSATDRRRRGRASSGPLLQHSRSSNRTVAQARLFGQGHVLATCSAIHVHVLATGHQVFGKMQFAGESAYGFVRNGVAIEILGGANGRKWAGFLATLFSFIIVQNLWGIVPLAQMPVTSHFAIPVLLALTVWFIYMFVGIQKHGFFGFFKLMCYIPGIPAAMHLLLIPIEFLSNIILRPFTLAIRLFANMFAGHMLITIAAVGTLYLWGTGTPVNIRAGHPAVRRQPRPGLLRAADLLAAGLRVRAADRDLPGIVPGRLALTRTA